MAMEREGPRIVAVDDDAVSLNLINFVLKSVYNVVPFTSGAQALTYLGVHKADMILLDCDMPGLSGFEVMDRIMADEGLNKIPVIFLTGSIDGDDEINALERGAVDYIQKPIKPRPLHVRVKIQLELMAHRQHLERLVDEKTEQLAMSNIKIARREQLTMELLAKAGDLRDHETGEHIQRTKRYIELILEDLIDCPRAGYEMTRDMARDIAEASQLHDIGKLAMPDHVLRKPGKLTPDEFDIVKEHPKWGRDILEEAVAKTPEDLRLRESLNIAYSHHEKWNGKGYPLGLSSGDIPLSARIAAIADVFDALTSDRPYKKAFPADKALGIIYQEAGEHFDPYLVSIVKKHEDGFMRIRDSKGFGGAQEEGGLYA